MVGENFDRPRQKPEDLIMSAEQYAEKPHETPYTYEVHSRDAAIHYFGANHTYDPQNPQFEAIEKKFNESKPDLVLIEGIASEHLTDPAVIEMIQTASRETTIEKVGEGGFSAWLATKNNIELDSPEPSMADQIQHLLNKGFSKEHIFGHFYYRQIGQYHRQYPENKDAPPLNEDIPQSMQDFVAAAQWEGFDYSLKHLETIGKSIWPTNYKVDDPSKAEERDDPIPWKDRTYSYTVVNEIACENSKFRDRHIIGKLGEYLERGKKKIFIVYGASHAVMQEPAISTLLETNS